VPLDKLILQITATAGGEDRGDNICRSSAFASDCTADSVCNGVEAGTGDCSATCTLITPDPSIGIELIYPTEDINVTQNRFFNVTVNVSCLDANCGNINVSLDPKIALAKLPPRSSSTAIVKNSTGSLFVLAGVGPISPRVYISDDSGATWITNVVDLDCDIGPGILLINSSDALHVVCEDVNTDNLDTVYSIDSGASWSAPVEVRNYEVDYLSGVVDSNNNLILCTSNSTSIDIYNSSNSGITWTATLDVLTDVDDECAIEADSKGMYHLAAGDASSTQIVYANTTDPTNWGTITTVDNGAGFFLGISIAIGNDDEIFIIHREIGSSGDFSFYNSTDGLSWTETEVPMGSGNREFPNIVVDSLSTIHVTGDGITRVSYSNSTNGGLNWNTEIALVKSLDIDYPHLRGSKYPSFNNVNGVLEYVFFNDTDNNVYFENFSIPSPKGLISTTVGATPFYTNESNPRSINLNANESELVIFWVNSTGELDTTWEFFAFATLADDSSITNTTSTVDITIRDGLIQSELLTNLSEIYQNSPDTLRVFRFVINNTVNSTDNFTWDLNTGESTIESTESISLATNETVFTYFEYNYTSGGSYEVIATVNSGDYFDTESININV